MATSHSKNFSRVKMYYAMHIWDETKVHNVVGKMITAAEYKEITGKTYTK